MRKQIDRVLHDVALGFEIGENVDRGIGDEKRLRMGRNVHDEDVADASRGAQTRGPGCHLAHQLIRMQAPLHQKLAPGLANQLNCFAASLCGASTSSQRAMSIPCCLATAVILPTGPTRMGTMMPSSAAALAPRSEFSSQGWATTVVAGRTPLAIEISFSYLLWGGCPKGSPLGVAPISLSW